MTQETKQQMEAISDLGEVIADGESKRGGYNAYNSGVLNGRVTYSGVKDLAKMTVDQILESSNLRANNRDRVFAAGKYQVITQTLREAKRAIPLSGSELYTPELQEKIFLEFLLGKKRPKIAAYIKRGEGTSEDATYSAAMEWASIEVPAGRPITRGRISNGHHSYYEGPANHAKKGSGPKTKAALERARAAFAGIQNGQTVERPEPIVDEQESPAQEGGGTVTALVTELRPIAPGHIIAASVGKGGTNHASDVGAVQSALAQHGVSPGAIDQQYGPKTHAAITQFQSRFLRRPDGLVEVGKATEKHLVDGTQQAETPGEQKPAEQKPAETETPAQTPTSDGTLGALMQQEHLDAAQLAQARELIAKEPKAQREALYRALQAKVLYANQRDNQATLGGKKIETPSGNMCNLTSLAMCLQYLGVPNPHPEMQYEDALEQVRQDKRLPGRIYEGGWGGVASALGVKHKMLAGAATHPRTWWQSVVGGALGSGQSVMCSITGHIVRIQDVTADGLVVDDPYGRRILSAGGKKAWKTVENNNAKNAAAGEDNLWTWDQVEPHSFLWVAAFSR
jgi:peptidoglycan hydrolase-like protein with peptidoglycan-binding domain